MGLLIYISALFLVVPVLYSVATMMIHAQLPAIRNKNVCLLIAHPDDEAMFFAPTILALTRTDANNHLKILCLSSGDSAGLGETRKRELTKSAMLMGLRSEEDVTVVESPDFPDSMTTTWEPSKIATQINSTYSKGHNLDVLITFDSNGISKHPNHISLYHGARHFVKQSQELSRPVPSMYTLTTVNMARKYMSYLDGFIVLMTNYPKPPLPDTTPKSLVYMNKLTGVEEVEHADIGKTEMGPALGRAWSAMITAHKSQMVWFRWGWIFLSRYMSVNELELEVISN